MLFFFPHIHQEIDWSLSYEFLDKELQKVLKDAKMKRRLVDKLVKVWLKNGEPAVLYIHIEVQGQYEENFAQRMYVYHYRLFDCHGSRVISLAILGDNRKDWVPSSYSYQLFGLELTYRFPVIKLLDYWEDKEKWEALKKSNNPFSIVVRTHILGLKTQRSSKKRFDRKVELFKALHEEKYSKEDIWELFRFMDWVLTLPQDLERQFEDFTQQYEDENKMPYVTSIERNAIAKGLQQGALQTSQKSVIDILRVRFKRIPQSLVKMVCAIDDLKLLSRLLKKTVVVDSLDAFKQLLEKQVSRES